MSPPPPRPFYLPIAADAAAAFFDQSSLPGTAVERAALFAGLAHLRKPLPHVALECFLDIAERTFAANMLGGEQQLLESLRAFPRLTSRVALSSFAATGVAYAPAVEMYARSWQGGDGHYCYSFQEICHRQHQQFGNATRKPLTCEVSAAQRCDRRLCGSSHETGNCLTTN